MSDLFATRTLRRIGFVRTGELGDVEAFERAVRLCVRSRAELRIVRAIEGPPSGILGLIAAWSVGVESLADAEAERREVERLVDAARAQGVSASGEVISGSGVELIRLVLREKHDLLIKAAEPASTLRQMLFGRLDRTLIHKCPCPVWIERPGRRCQPERILAAVDPDPFCEDHELTPVRDELNIAILEMAKQVSQAEEAELHVAHVWPFHLEGPLQSRGGLTPEAVAQVGHSIRQRHELALSTLTEHVIADLDREHLLKGNPGDELAKLAASESFDVIVMGTATRPGMLDFLLGGTADAVLDQVECSVVAIKPPGFASPIAL